MERTKLTNPNELNQKNWPKPKNRNKPSQTNPTKPTQTAKKLKMYRCHHNSSLQMWWQFFLWVWFRKNRVANKVRNKWINCNLRLDWGIGLKFILLEELLLLFHQDEFDWHWFWTCYSIFFFSKMPIDINMLIRTNFELSNWKFNYENVVMTKFRCHCMARIDKVI